jgi:hypothetical protein
VSPSWRFNPVEKAAFGWRGSHFSSKVAFVKQKALSVRRAIAVLQVEEDVNFVG